MDARALLAIVLLLWLIRTWVNWDVQIRQSRLSRQQLRNRLYDSMLRVQGRPGSATPVAVLATNAHSVNVADTTVPQSNEKRRLEEQLDTLEAHARATNQSDLELRRLRSELESVHSGRASDGADIDALEARLNEQKTALAMNIQRSTLQSNDNGAHQDTSSHQQSATPPAAVNSGGVTANQTTKTPLYQAPDEKDDLKLIKGIGPVMERTLNDLGVTTFKQLANFEQEDIDKVSAAIGAFSGRIERDDWVGKAQQFLREKSSV